MHFRKMTQKSQVEFSDIEHGPTLGIREPVSAGWFTGIRDWHTVCFMVVEA
jgi:hypothetical protein